MYTGHYVFHQLVKTLSRHIFQKFVDEYHGDHYVKHFSCWKQFLCLVYGQLVFRESLRSIVVCLNTFPEKLYHLGLTDTVDLTTLSRANNKRSWKIYRDFGMYLIKKARLLYQHDPIFLEDLDGTFYALDSSTIDLCLSVFGWAHFRKNKAAVKIHALLDLRGNIPSFIRITTGSVHDVNILDELEIEPGSFYVIDRGYLDFERLMRIEIEKAFFITRAKSNFCFARIYSHEIDKSGGLRCDQTIRLTGYQSKKDYPEKLRRIKYYDEEHDKTYVFLTNNFEIEAQQVADLYKQRWQIELFFKWIKGHLRIKKFWGYTENAVKTQIWVAIATYLMVAIIKKQLKSERSMYEILQILSTAPFEKVPLDRLFFDGSRLVNEPSPNSGANLTLF